MLASVACIKVDSSSVRTQGMSAVYTITAQSNGTVEAAASLYQGETNSLINIEVKGSDKLNVSVGQTDKEMTKIELLNLVSYGATFNGENSPGNEFTFKFARSVDAGAPHSFCDLPAAFEITQPLMEPKFKRSMDDIVVAYSPASTTDRIRYSLSGSCIQEKEYPFEGGDLGTFTIPRANLLIASDDKKAEACDVTIKVRRYRPGNLDTGFGKGGKIECIQERAVRFRSEQ